MRATLEDQIRHERLQNLEALWMAWEARSPWYKIVAARTALNLSALWFMLRGLLGFEVRS